MALPVQGLGLVGTSIVRNGITFASHLQFINWTNQHEIEIDNDIVPQDWSFRIDAVDSATFNRPASDFAHTGAIDLGGRLAENVWALAIQATNSIDAAGLTYELLTQNSNSFINSLMLSLGININSYLSTVTPQNDGLGFVGVCTDMRDKVVFTISGTNGDDWFFSGAKNDVLFGGAGNDNTSLAAEMTGLKVALPLTQSMAAMAPIACPTTAVPASPCISGIPMPPATMRKATPSATLKIWQAPTRRRCSGRRCQRQCHYWVRRGGLAEWPRWQRFADRGRWSRHTARRAGSDYFYGGTEADYFYVAGDEISSSDVDYMIDFSAASGDYVLLPIALQGSTFFASYGSYAVAYVVSGAGYYTFVAANTSVADLQSHTYFF